MIKFQALNKFIREHFQSLDESNELRHLSLKNYIDIIDHDEINVENEDVIFSNVVQIIEQQTSEEDTRRCLKLIRYPHISSDYLIEVVQEHPLMKEPPQNRYVREALKYHVNKSSTQIVKPCRTWHDSRHTCTYYIAADEYVYRYETKDGLDTCTNMMCLSGYLLQGCAVAIHAGRKCVIMLGGIMQYTGTQIVCTKRVRFLDITSKNNEPRTLPDLLVPIYNAGIALSDNNVYVMGGQKNDSKCMNSLFCLSLGNERWKRIRAMPHALRNPLAIHHQPFIYVLGGRLNNHEQQSSVSKYNIQYNAWVRCSDMPVSCDSMDARVVVQNGKVKVVTKDQLLVYDEVTDTWSINHFNRFGEFYNIFVKRGQICAAVAEPATWMKTHRVMCYDDVRNEWITEKEVYNTAFAEQQSNKTKSVLKYLLFAFVLFISWMCYHAQERKHY